jgi:hypothetical protein
MLFFQKESGNNNGLPSRLCLDTRANMGPKEIVSFAADTGRFWMDKREQINRSRRDLKQPSEEKEV